MARLDNGTPQGRRVNKMKIYSYSITRDYGFAPNPYFGICTLATCKPKIRSGCQIGDWVIGFGGSNLPTKNKLIFIMEVSEKMSFDEYWEDSRFLIKKPRFDKSIKYCYGDNIYHHNEAGEWIQENSHHSYGDRINEKNLKTDTGRTDQVLISNNYWYFGDEALELEERFKCFLPKCRDCKKFSDDKSIRIFKQLVDYLSQNYDKGMNGIPYTQKKKVKFTTYKGA